MGLQEEVYTAMLEVGYSAKREKIPGPIAHTMIDVAQRSLEHWRADSKALETFAIKVLSGPTNLRVSTGGLTCDACWRLIRLLEYIAENGC